MPRKTILRLAVMADVDPRSVETYLQRTRTTQAQKAARIRGALMLLGMQDPHPQNASAPI